MISIKIPILSIIALNILAFIILKIFGLIDFFSDFVFLSVYFLIILFFPLKKVQIGKFTKFQEQFLFLLILFIICIELIYFTPPILGRINYTDFGFTIFHHLSLMLWLLILFGEKKFKYLVINSIYCVLIFNRQFLIFGLISFILTNKYTFSKFHKFLFFASIGSIILGLGILRNHILEVDFKPFSGFIILPFFEFYDFVLFYILGPYTSVSEDVDPQFYRQISLFWNTKPEWYFFSSIFRINPVYSFGLFYIFFLILSKIILAFFYKKAKFYIPILFLFLFFTFFSNVIVTTVFIANIVIIEFLFLITKIRSKSSIPTTKSA
jgi:hypothetical protein